MHEISLVWESLAPGYGLLVALISLPTNLSSTMHKLGSFSNGSLYTDVVLFFFSFFSLLPHLYPLALSVNKFPAVFYFLSCGLDGL